MKKIIALLGLLILGQSLQAQTITSGEYFFDTAPNLGGGTSFSLTPADTVNQTLNVSVASLSAGFHNMFVRVKNTAGIWSHYEGRLFYVIPPVLTASAQPAIASGEWFVDTDPGLGNGTAINFSQTDTVNQVININAASFTTGFHNLFIRVKNTMGIWSHYEGRLFYVIPPVTSSPQPALVSGEWFVDTDPGLGNGTAISFAQADTVNPILNVVTSALSIGTHHLFIRVKNLSGTWSHYEGRPFTVCATLPATPSITGNSVLCVGATLNLNASTVSGATSYNWTGPNGFTATTQNITINNVTGLMNGVYSVNAISGTSICDTSNAGSINVSVTVTDNINPTITAPVNLNISTNSSCTATGVNLGTPITADNCSVATINNNAPTAFPIGTTTVIWTVTDGSGNTATTLQTVTVTDNTNPTITAPVNISVCVGSAVVLGSPITSDNCSVSSVTNNASTSYPVGTTPVIWTVIDGNGNSATATQMITVNSMPNITTNLVGATINSNQSGATYNWADCNNNYSLVPGTSSSYTATVNGNYAVIVSLGACIDTSECVSINDLSISKIINENPEVKIFPNPTNDKVIIDSEVGLISSINLRDLNGKLLISRITSSKMVQLDISELSVGVYLVECVTENGTHIERIVIEH